MSGATGLSVRPRANARTDPKRANQSDRAAGLLVPGVRRRIPSKSRGPPRRSPVRRRQCCGGPKPLDLPPAAASCSLQRSASPWWLGRLRVGATFVVPRPTHAEPLPPPRRSPSDCRNRSHAKLAPILHGHRVHQRRFPAGRKLPLAHSKQVATERPGRSVGLALNSPAHRPQTSPPTLHLAQKFPRCTAADRLRSHCPELETHRTTPSSR